MRYKVNYEHPSNPKLIVGGEVILEGYAPIQAWIRDNCPIVKSLASERPPFRPRRTEDGGSL